MIEFRAAGATLTLSPGESGVLDPGQVPSTTQWQVVFFDVGRAHVFDGGTFDVCGSPPTTSTSVPPTSSVSATEGCDDGDPVVKFTNTGTTTIYASIGTFAEPIDPGLTATAPWPTADGDLPPVIDWHAHEVAPTGGIGQEFTTGTAFLVNACAEIGHPQHRRQGSGGQRDVIRRSRCLGRRGPRRPDAHGDVDRRTP